MERIYCYFVWLLAYELPFCGRGDVFNPVTLSVYNKLAILLRLGLGRRNLFVYRSISEKFLGSINLTFFLETDFRPTHWDVTNRFTGCQV